jgi:hypothetical protein
MPTARRVVVGASGSLQRGTFDNRFPDRSQSATVPRRRVADRGLQARGLGQQHRAASRYGRAAQHEVGVRPYPCGVRC